jgi:exodeoxyribonuclease VII large subunit
MPSLFDLPFDDAEPRPEDRPRGPQLPPILTVSELTADVRAALEVGFADVRVEGEISNCRAWNTGHLYFTLKDAGAQIRAVMFRSAARLLKFKVQDGQHVVARGRVSVYDTKGEYQVICETLEPRGLGALQLAFEQLKRKLAAEGLFEQSRKRALPLLPRKIGLVTSLDGAAVRDVLSVLNRRYPNAHIVIRPARVQGDGAAPDVARALGAVGRVPGVDVVLLVRGGGSIEDLWAFNEEIVARAIRRCDVPVISGVGHETDVTIADFAADLRCPTPSAAAETVVARRDEFVARIDRHLERVRAALDRRLLGARSRVHALESRRGLAAVRASVAMHGRHVMELGQTLQRAMTERAARDGRRLALAGRGLARHDPRARLARSRGRLDRLGAQLVAGIHRRHQQSTARLSAGAGRLHSLSPLAVLGRGYAVCWDGARERIVRRAADVATGDAVRVTLGEGEISCEVTRVEPDTAS